MPTPNPGDTLRHKELGILLEFKSTLEGITTTGTTLCYSGTILDPRETGWEKGAPFADKKGNWTNTTN